MHVKNKKKRETKKYDRNEKKIKKIKYKKNRVKVHGKSRLLELHKERARVKPLKVSITTV